MLALREGATENAEAAKDLLEHPVSHGVNLERRRLFVIDGSKALRSAINAVFGAGTPVQRCRNHNCATSWDGWPANRKRKRPP